MLTAFKVTASAHRGQDQQSWSFTVALCPKFGTPKIYFQQFIAVQREHFGVSQGVIPRSYGLHFLEARLTMQLITSEMGYYTIKYWGNILCECVDTCKLKLKYWDQSNILRNWTMFFQHKQAKAVNWKGEESTISGYGPICGGGHHLSQYGCHHQYNHQWHHHDHQNIGHDHDCHKYHDHPYHQFHCHDPQRHFQKKIWGSSDFAIWCDVMWGLEWQQYIPLPWFHKFLHK